ncbi:hypothetical protein KBY96_12015 [Cyanobium sp. ATX 6A2]|uniref:hypothetical protein n=1 Tax=Cyanobium sp. ATX 6A2 TaxID=2823700 RepID=UPI0020CC51C6|nr:hypothetical protein [Cyanobium sp. ATX 6A2]MCP9888647.1 hypothetical protein [Cyanobium sp. ATX 6A2]
MDPIGNRRLTVAVSWALARQATLDCLEHFEESYALTEEFREWLLCLDEHPELIADSVLMVPRNLGRTRGGEALESGSDLETDGLLEI